MADIDFTAILGKQVGSAPEPKPLPEGTYTGTISSVPVTRTVHNKKENRDSPVLTLTIDMGDALDDVDVEELTAAGGLRRNDGEPKKMKYDFFLDESSMYQYDRFLETFGYSEAEAKTYEEANLELVGREVTMAVVQRTYKDRSGATRVANDIQRIFATQA